jgi:hypothetical protein
MKLETPIFCTQKVFGNTGHIEPEEQKPPEIEEEQPEEKITEDFNKDERMRHFVMEMTEEEKDQLSCDEVFALYLRHVSKIVNENYYRTVIRFVLLYRECLNECGWLKRREHFEKAYSGEGESCCIDDKDEVLSRLKKAEQLEEENERLKAEEKIKKMMEEEIKVEE